MASHCLHEQAQRLNLAWSVPWPLPILDPYPVPLFPHSGHTDLLSASRSLLLLLTPGPLHLLVSLPETNNGLLTKKTHKTLQKKPLADTHLTSKQIALRPTISDSSVPLFPISIPNVIVFSLCPGPHYITRTLPRDVSY